MNKFSHFKVAFIKVPKYYNVRIISYINLTFSKHTNALNTKFHLHYYNAFAIIQRKAGETAQRHATRRVPEVKGVVAEHSYIKIV